MRFLLAWIFRQPLVWLIDHDGVCNLRWAHCDGVGHAWAHRQPFGIRTVFLEANGSIRTESYVTRWEPANKPATRLFKETA